RLKTLLLPGGTKLVTRAPDLFAAERRDHALDLPPVAEARDIAVVAAAFGAKRGLEAGVVAIARHEVGRVGQRRAAVDEGAVHAHCITRQPFPDRRQMSSTLR